jgi:hypothetical protein
MSSIVFPYALHKGYLMPIIPLTVEGHKLWAYVDSGAVFSIFHVAEAERIGIDWQRGRQQMVVVGDGSFIPVYFHDISFTIGKWQMKAPVGFSERLGVGFNLLGRTGVFNRCRVCFNDKDRITTFHQL